MYIKIVLALNWQKYTKKSYTVINNKILNFGLLRSNKNRFVGQKYKMKEIIDIVRVLGL